MAKKSAMTFRYLSCASRYFLPPRYNVRFYTISLDSLNKNIASRSTVDSLTTRFSFSRSTSTFSPSYMITTPIFYVNSKPHIGHLYTSLLADAHFRYRACLGQGHAGLGQQQGQPVIFSTGTDEHGLKVQQAADRSGISPQDLCDGVSTQFRQLFERTGIGFTDFLRTSDPRHIETVIKVWEQLEKDGWLYKSEYEGWYSVSDECFLPETQVDRRPDGQFSLESGHPVVWSSETNWMFRLSEHRQRLLNWLEVDNPIRPRIFQSQVQTWLSDTEMSDLSVSRPRSRLHWGVPVPADPDQTVYVWLDALVNYLTVAGYPDTRCWPPSVHLIGKDILKFHAVYWPAFLLSLSLPLPQRIQVHSHWTVDGVKMSKSLGNVVDPDHLISQYSVDGTRYFLLREGVPDHDGNFSESRMAHTINLELADTLGNLLNRATSRAVNPEQKYPPPTFDDHTEITRTLLEKLTSLSGRVGGEFEDFRFHSGIVDIMDVLRLTNLMVQEEKPWTLKTSNPDRLQFVLYISLESLRICGILLQPVVPNISHLLLTKLGVTESDRFWDKAVPGDDINHRSLSVDKTILFRKIR